MKGTYADTVLIITWICIGLVILLGLMAGLYNAVGWWDRRAHR